MKFSASSFLLTYDVIILIHIFLIIFGDNCKIRYVSFIEYDISEIPSLSIGIALAWPQCFIFAHANA